MALPNQHEIHASAENAVRRRQRGTARALIRRSLRNGVRRNSEDALVQASEWYRRLGDFRMALQVLRPELLMRAPRRSGDPRGRALLQMARILNFLGANEFAAKIASEFECEGFEDFRVLGQIWLDQFEYQIAVPLLEKAVALHPQPGSYDERLTRIAFADACCAVGLGRRANEIASGVARQTNEPLLKGICLQAQGEYWARMGDFERAKRQLWAAIPFFPAREDTVDSAILWKWVGYVAAREGDLAGAKSHFARAEQIFLRPEIRPEGLLDLIRLKRVAGGEVLVENKEWSRVLHYPGLTSGFLGLLADENAGSRNAVFGMASRARVTIDLTRQESNLSGALRFGLGVEDRCLAALGQVGEWGISFMRMQSVLWPDEPFSILGLRSRLEAVLHRLRRAHRLEIDVKEGRICLPPESRKQVRVLAGEPLPPSLLETAKVLRRSDVESAYRVSSTQAGNYLKTWSDRGWIDAEGAGRARKYTRKKSQ